MEPSKLIQWKKIIDSKAQAKKESIYGMTLKINDWYVWAGKRSVVSICVHVHFTVESSMGLMEAVLKSLEAVLFRLNGEAWQQQHQHRDSRESEIHIRNTQVSHSETWTVAYFPVNMICFKFWSGCLWHIADFFNWHEWTESTAGYRSSFFWPGWEEISLSAPFEHSTLCEWRGSGQADGAHTSHQNSAGHTAVSAGTQPKAQSTGR